MMRASHEDKIAQALDMAKKAVPKRYILRSPELNLLRRKREEESAPKHLVATTQQLLKASHESTSVLDISQSETTVLPPPSAQLRNSAEQEQPKSNAKEEPPYFLAFGCHGESPKPFMDYPPKRVADKFINDLKKIREKKGKLPAFVLILGDNFYDNGVDSPDSKAFKEIFEYLYGELAALGIPCIVILGNHDENLHRGNVISTQARGIAQGINQVAHTYLLENAENLYGMNSSSPTIDLQLSELPLWNMPNRFYSLDFVNTEIFCIDTNTYVKDYFEYLACVTTGKPIDPNNQAVWLERESKRAKAEGKHVLFAQHHPLLTPGKRFEDADSYVYFNIPQDPLSPEALKLAERYFPGISKGEKFSFSDLLKKVYELQKLQPDAIMHAHDHNMYYINRPGTETDPMTIRQFCFGGGGGSIQQRKYFGGIQDYLGCHIDHHGIGKVVCDKELLFSMQTTNDKYHVEFTLKNKYPRRHYTRENSSELKQVEDFCIAVKRAINAYFKKGGGGVKGIARAHDVWAYISNSKADSLAKTVLTVKERMLQDYHAAPKSGSLITYLNQELLLAYKVQSLQEFAAQFENAPRMVKSN